MGRYNPPVKVREVLNLLKKDGWKQVRRLEASGSEVREIPMKYAVVIEKGPNSYGAYVPDLPGCVAAGNSRAEVVQLIQEAIELHIEGLRESGEPVPPPSSSIELVEVAA